MLQIISGRFFKSPARHAHPAKAVLYSNFNWLQPITTCVGTLEPVDFSGAVASYVFSYTNQIEQTGGNFGLVRVGDAEIVRQFQVICTFGLRAYFAHDRSVILTNCRDKHLGYTDRFLPSAFAPRIFDSHVGGTPGDAAGFSSLVDQIISMPRECYSAFVNVLDNLDHALQILNWNLDLSYSMLVYCSESLCQTFDSYTPIWADYDDSTRTKLDAALTPLDPSIAKSIRDILLSGAHQKLSARFLDFIETHLAPSFFVEEASGNPHPMTKALLRRALKNAYTLRSGYVHRLQPLRQQLRDARLGLGDVFIWDKEPYPTYRGLLRVVFHVLRQFVARQPHTPTEDFDWYKDLPGRITLQAAPEYWIALHDHLSEQTSKQTIGSAVRDKLSGLLTHLVRVVEDGGGITDLRGLIAKYEALERVSSTTEKLRMRVTSYIYNSLVQPPGRTVDWEKGVFKEDKIIESCTIETILAALLIQERFDEPHEKCIAVYDKYHGERFSKNVIEIPRVIEIKLLCELANMASQAGDLEQYERMSDLAVYEAGGLLPFQELVQSAKSQATEIDHRRIFTLQAPASVQDAGGSTSSPPTAADSSAMPSGPSPSLDNPSEAIPLPDRATAPAETLATDNPSTEPGGSTGGETW